MRERDSSPGRGKEDSDPKGSKVSGSGADMSREMSVSALGPISPELVLVTPELRLALIREFESELAEVPPARQEPIQAEASNGHGGGASRDGASNEVAELPAPPLLLSAAAYTLSRILVLAAQTAAVAVAGVLLVLILSRL